MGLVNYVLENQELTEMRLRDLSNDDFLLDNNPSHRASNKKKSIYCPLCRKQISGGDSLRTHFNKVHQTNNLAFFMLNNQIILSDVSYEKLDFLSVYNFGDTKVRCTISRENQDIESFFLGENDNYKNLSKHLKLERYCNYLLKIEEGDYVEEYLLKEHFPNRFWDIKNIF